MKQKALSDKIKKNLLDLQYNKYLQYYNTSIIILFTYIIGVAIAFITKQINYKSMNEVGLAGIISIAVISIIVIFMLRMRDHIQNIPNKIKKLKL
ncbi:MAG: hypothetical protein U9R34_07350 [Nanoarchaeota archaeon]|nr:hypothetical protein [Nanoarchaeota archaeon]